MCKLCNFPSINKKYDLCYIHNYERLHGCKSKNKPIKYKRKKTGEKDLFLEIWNERPHTCTYCTKNLGTDPKPIYFSHIKSKGACPELRLDKNNIELVCEDCHYIYEFGDRSKLNKK